MNEVVITDAGPLVAYLDRSDAHHAWARDQMARLTEPLLTCEAVMAEAWHLLRRGRIDPDHLLALVQQGALIAAFDFMMESVALRAQIHRYRSVPMSLADACLVRMSEQHEVGLPSFHRRFRLHHLPPPQQENDSAAGTVCSVNGTAFKRVSVQLSPLWTQTPAPAWLGHARQSRMERSWWN